VSRPATLASEFGTTLVHLWLTARSALVGRLVVVTFLFATVLVGVATVSLVNGSSAAVAPSMRIGLLVFFTLLTATWLTLAVEQTRTELTTPTTVRSTVIGLVSLGPTLLVGALLTWGTVTFAVLVLDRPIQVPVTDFASCVAANGVVLNTVPAQCVVTAGTFVEPTERAQ
jgi:hypothetical protein